MLMITQIQKLHCSKISELLRVSYTLIKSSLYTFVKTLKITYKRGRHYLFKDEQTKAWKY